MESDIAFCSSLMLLPEHNYWISFWLIKWSLIKISEWKTQWFNQTGNEDKNGIIRRGDRHDIIFFSPDSVWNPLSHHLKARNIWLLPKKYLISKKNLYSPSTMTTQSVVSEPRLLVATHLYLPLSLGWQLMISMVMTPSVCVIGNRSDGSGFPDCGDK